MKVKVQCHCMDNTIQSPWDDFPDKPCSDCNGQGYQEKELFEKDPDQSLPEMNPVLRSEYWITPYQEAQKDMIKEGWVKVKK